MCVNVVRLIYIIISQTIINLTKKGCSLKGVLRRTVNIYMSIVSLIV